MLRRFWRFNLLYLACSTDMVVMDWLMKLGNGCFGLYVPDSLVTIMFPLHVAVRNRCIRLVYVLL